MIPKAECLRRANIVWLNLDHQKKDLEKRHLSTQLFLGISLEDSVNSIRDSFLNMIDPYSFQNYAAGPLDHNHGKENHLGSIDKRTQNIFPMKTQTKIFQKLDLPELDFDNPLTYIYLTDAFNPLLMISCEEMTVSYSGITVGVGFENYLALLSKLGLFMPEWNPKLSMTGDTKDPLFEYILSHDDLRKVVSIYDPDWKLINQTTEQENIESDSGKEILEKLIRDMKSIAKDKRKIKQSGSYTLFDLAGGTHVLNPKVEPFMPFLYSHFILTQSNLHNSENGFFFPTYQSVNTAVWLPWSSRQVKTGQHYDPDIPTDSNALYVKRFTSHILSESQFKNG